MRACEEGETASSEWTRRYCPLEQGETVSVSQCEGCPHRPAPPYRLCAPPRQARPRRRGFWDVERTPG